MTYKDYSQILTAIYSVTGSLFRSNIIKEALLIIIKTEKEGKYFKAKNTDMSERIKHGLKLVVNKIELSVI